MPLHHFKNAQELGGRLLWIVEQGFQVSAQNGERRPQFVGDIGNEIPSHSLGLSQFGNVAKENDGAVYLGGLVFDRFNDYFEMTFRTRRPLDGDCTSLRSPVFESFT